MVGGCDVGVVKRVYIIVKRVLVVKWVLVVKRLESSWLVAAT